MKDVELDEKQGLLKEKLASILEQIQHRDGISQAEVRAHYYSGYSINVREGDIDTLKHYQDQGLTIVAYCGKRTGSSSTTDWSQESIQATLERAYAIAQFTGEDPCSGLADSALMADPHHLKEVSTHQPWALSVEEAIAQAKQCEAHGLRYDQRIIHSEGVRISNTEKIIAYANSEGFIGSYPQTLHSQSCTFVAQEGHDKQRDYEYTVAHLPDLLMSNQALAESASKMAVDRLNAKTLSARQCPVLMPPRIASEWVESFFDAINGYSLYQGASFLLNHLEKPVFPDWLTIEESAEIPGAIGSLPFDAEGVQPKPRKRVDRGILKSYILDSYTGRKLGLQSTGNAGGIHTMTFSHQDYGFDDLLQQMGRGLLVTETLGDGVNLVTGDYSVGAFGFWVEKGCIQYPVQGITIAGNLKSLFRNLQHIGSDIDTRSKIRVGSIVLDSMTVGS